MEFMLNGVSVDKLQPDGFCEGGTVESSLFYEFAFKELTRVKPITNALLQQQRYIHGFAGIIEVTVDDEVLMLRNPVLDMVLHAEYH